MSEEKITRRGFVGALAGALAGVAAAAAPTVAAERKPRRRDARGASGSPTAAVRAEIQNQKKYVAQTVQKLRAYKLAPGSDVAFVFRAKGRARRAGEKVS